MPLNGEKAILPKNQSDKGKKATLREVVIKPAENGFVISSRKDVDGECHFEEPTQYVEKDIEGALKQVRAILEE